MPSEHYSIAMYDEDTDSDAFDGPDAIVEDDGDENYTDEESMEEGQSEVYDLEQDIEGLAEEAALHNAVRFDVHSVQEEPNASVAVEGDGSENPAELRISNITLRQLRRLFLLADGGRRPLSFRVVDNDEEEDDDDDDDNWTRRFISGPPAEWRYPQTTVPQKPGLELLMSGEFGRIGHKIRSKKHGINISRRIFDRTTSSRGLVHKEDLASDLVPNSDGSVVAKCGANIYSGQYSADSSFYYTCAQDFRLRVYDTSAPLMIDGGKRRNPYLQDTFRNVDGDEASMMKIKNVIQGSSGYWTITDSHLSPDNERMIYSNMSSTVFMTSISEYGSQSQIPIPFSEPYTSRRAIWETEERFRIWSCRFSADGNEVIAGGSHHIFVYDLLANKRTVKIYAHDDDVNSCCWADTASGNILISASDDSFIKVWDRRSLGSSQRPSGVLIGHTEGITNVSAKGDGRYIISNGKDQTLRLWDLRKMHSDSHFDRVKDDNYSISGFDYRDGYYPKPKHLKHPNDCSVMTYTGHAVLRTLIRCHFSPAATTGSQYIYSGSADGRIHIWNLDGTVAQILDRSASKPFGFDPTDIDFERTTGRRRTVCVRDVSWHSQEPVMLSVGWEAGARGSTVAHHEWKGMSKLAGGLKDWVQKVETESSEAHSRSSR